MRKKSFETHTLHEPQMALRVYLDALLCEVNFATSEDDVPPVQQEAAVEAPAEIVQLIKKSERESLDVIAKLAETVVPVTNQSDDEESVVLYPDWAKTRFQCLSFQVAGVTLAAPLEKLHGIVELQEAITELPGYAPWVMGLLPHRGQNVQVVDIAEIIMPDDRRANICSANERTKYLILIDGGQFGIAVDSISQVLTLERDDVRWRSNNSRRPWLAGTVVDKMCALLELDQLCRQLQTGLNNVD
jgi:purine-binding chemotaxis protein CheW